MEISAIQMGMDLPGNSQVGKAHASSRQELNPENSSISISNSNSNNVVPIREDLGWTATNENKDYFIVRDGKKFAGTHLIIDLWGAENLDNLEIMEKAMREAVIAAKATLLHIHLHHFTPNGGISGVAVLAESHISVHSWPEKGFAAFDVFTCGESEPHKAVDVLRQYFTPERVDVGENLRGLTTSE